MQVNRKLRTSTYSASWWWCEKERKGCRWKSENWGQIGFEKVMFLCPLQVKVLKYESNHFCLITAEQFPLQLWKANSKPAVLNYLSQKIGRLTSTFQKFVENSFFTLIVSICKKWYEMKFFFSIIAIPPPSRKSKIMWFFQKVHLGVLQSLDL